MRPAQPTPHHEVSVFGKFPSRRSSLQPSALRLLGLAALLALAAAPLRAQARPAVRGGGQSIWAGGEFSRFAPDFGPAPHLRGIGAYADLNFSSRWGVEAEARFLRFHEYKGQHEDTYFIGPRVTIVRLGKFRPYGKLLLGLGEIQFPFQIGHGGYFAFAPGGGLDYRLTRRIALRAEYEHQFWPSAPGIAGEPSHGLQPNGLSAGVAWRLR